MKKLGLEAESPDVQEHAAVRHPGESEAPILSRAHETPPLREKELGVRYGAAIDVAHDPTHRGRRDRDGFDCVLRREEAGHEGKDEKEAYA
jgi:hypothetical protein